MRTLVLIILSILMITGTIFSQNHMDIDKAMKAQEQAWNKGDILGFMSYYTTDSILSFVTSKGITKGHQQVLDRYLNTYPNRAAMGQLQFEIYSRMPLSSKFVMCTGSWRLLGLATEPNGYFTLIWEWNGKEWKIIYDHTS